MRGRFIPCESEMDGMKILFFAIDKLAIARANLTFTRNVETCPSPLLPPPQNNADNKTNMFLKCQSAIGFFLLFHSNNHNNYTNFLGNSSEPKWNEFSVLIEAQSSLYVMLTAENRLQK